VAELSGQAFSTVSERVARHLLDLAAGTRRADRLIVRTSQRELADAVGSVREVVVRTLRDLRERGIVRTERGIIVIVDPERLARVADSEWNEGS
jgi:CRP/FNR family transcriptional regulator